MAPKVGEDWPSESMILKFTDVDGRENLGEFMEKEVKVKLDPEPEVTEEYGVPYSEYSAKKKAE